MKVMEQKGLFELFFVLVMLVLLFPVATNKTTVSTPNVLIQADQLALLTEYAVSDALADQAFVNCNTTNITSRIESYLTTLKTEFNKTSGVNCSYENINIICNSGVCNSGQITIICDSNSSNTSTRVERKLNLEKKTVDTIPSSGYCKVTVKSGTPGVNQIDYNLSHP